MRDVILFLLNDIDVYVYIRLYEDGHRMLIIVKMMGI